MPRTAKAQSAEGETSQEKIKQLYLGEPQTTRERIREEPQGSTPPNIRENGAGEHRSTRPTSPSSYNPYVTDGQGQERVLFGKAHQRRMPSGLELKRIITLIYEHTFHFQLTNGNADQLATLPKEVLGREVKDLSDISEAEQSKLAVAVAERMARTPQQLTELMLGSESHAELCQYIFQTFYTPSIDYSMLASVVRGEDGEVLGHPIEEANKEVDNFLEAADVHHFFRTIGERASGTASD